MNKLLVILAFTLVPVLTIAQTAPYLKWANNMGGINGAGEGRAIKISTTQSVYAAGSFRGKPDFDPGTGTYYMNSAGSDDIFISRSNSAGTLIWARQLGGSSSDIANSIAVDVSGNVYTAGYFSGTADFDPGIGVFNLTSSGMADVFVSKLDASGNFVWAKKFGGLLSDYSYSIAVDASSNVYLSGDFAGTADFDPGSSTFNLTSAGSDDIFIVKLNSSGNFVWAKQMGGTLTDHSSALALDGSGNIYTTGNFKGTVDFDPGAGIYNLTSAGDYDIYISKFNSSGNFIWVKQFSGTGDDYGKAITIDGTGNVYSTGYFWNTTDFDPGAGTTNLTAASATDIYISKLDSAGNFSWVKQFAGGSYGYSYSIALDGFSNVYTTGAFGGTFDFDPGSNNYDLSAVDYVDIFVSKLNASGAFVWAKSMGGYDLDAGISIATGATGYVYYTGSFRGQVDFDPGPGTLSLNDPSTDFWPFFSQLDSQGNLIWVSTPGIYSRASGKISLVNTAGEVITGGAFFGTIDFDPGPGVFNLSTDPNDPWGDFYITKSDSSGNFIWVKQFYGLSENVIYTLKTDASGNIFVTGYFSGTVDFDPGPGTFNLTASSNSGDVFVLKLDTNGDFVWAFRIGSTLTDRAYSLSLDVSGNIYLIGEFRGIVDFDPGPATFNLTSVSSSNTFVAKFDGSGNLLWAKQSNGTSGALGTDIKIDGAGNIYLLGYFFDTIDLDPGAGVANLTSSGNSDIYIAKWDNSGNYLWAKQLGGNLGEYAFSLAIDSSLNVYTTGTFAGIADFDPGQGVNILTSTGSTDIFISKLDSSGNYVWAKQIGGNSNEYVSSICVDNAYNIYTTGYFSQTVDFDPGPSIYNLNSSGSSDIFILKLDSAGDFRWAKQFGGDVQDAGGSVTTDGSGNIYATGYFSGTIDFDPGTGVYNLTASSYFDVFVLKMGECSLPLATINASGPTTFCAGNSVTLNANTGIGYSYQWLKNGNPIPGATGPAYVATVAGNYSVNISSSGSASCYSTSNSIIVVVPCISLGPNQQRNSQNSGLESETIKTYPNPSTGLLYVDAPAGTLLLYNVFGQLLGDYRTNNQVSELDLSELPEGVYILKLKDGETLYTKSFILIR